MFQIQPQKQFSIVRKLADPADSGTYYVRAVIRNSITGATIATYDLVDQGGQRFTKVIQTPADMSGTGLQIDITTKVYSDASYTVQDTSYGDEVSDFLVMQIWNPAFGHGGGSGGPDIDYKKVRAIVEDVVLTAEKGREKPNLDLSPVQTHLTSIESLLEKCDSKLQEPVEKVDLSPVINKLSTVSTSIDDVFEAVSKIPTEKPEFDLSPVEAKLESTENSIRKSIEDHSVEMKGEFKTVASLLKAISFVLPNIKKIVEPVVEAVRYMIQDESLDIPEKEGEEDKKIKRANKIL